jgi:hypothetical protein
VRQLPAIADMIGDLVSDDQMVLSLGHGLDIVADRAGQAVADYHQPRVGIGERHLLVGGGLNGRLQCLQLLHLRREPGELVTQLPEPDEPLPSRLSWRSAASSAVRY